MIGADPVVSGSIVRPSAVAHAEPESPANNSGFADLPVGGRNGGAGTTCAVQFLLGGEGDRVSSQCGLYINN